MVARNLQKFAQLKDMQISANFSYKKWTLLHNIWDMSYLKSCPTKLILQSSKNFILYSEITNF